MTRPSLNEELKIIESLIGEQAEGIGVSALANLLAQRFVTATPRRTLQRRLDRLIHAGRIIAEGESVALVYKAYAPGVTFYLPEPIRAQLDEMDAP